MGCFPNWSCVSVQPERGKIISWSFYIFLYFFSRLFWLIKCLHNVVIFSGKTFSWRCGPSFATPCCHTPTNGTLILTRSGCHVRKTSRWHMIAAEMEERSWTESNHLSIVEFSGRVCGVFNLIFPLLVKSTFLHGFNRRSCVLTFYPFVVCVKESNVQFDMMLDTRALVTIWSFLFIIL